MSFTLTGHSPVIYTTGAYLCPMKTIDVQGKECWVWAVSEFDDASFMDGEMVNPCEIADNMDGLITE